MKNKIIAALLTLSMLLSQCLIMPTFAASDYEGHWAEEHIDKLITVGIVAGDENGKINPDNSIKRSEFVKIVNRKFNFTNAGTENFPDVSADAWYANEFKIAKAQGYLTGDDKGNANPDNPITRAEVSVIIARVLKLNDNYSSVKPFTDDSDIPSWAKDSVYRLNLKGYINGYPDGSFKAQNTITRAESFTIISKIQTNTSGSSSSEKPDNVEWREDGNIGLYTEIYSDKKIENVEDVIESLEDVKDTLNIENVDAEFVPFDDEGSKIDDNTYKIQQVYNGVPVANAQTIISVNEEGYPDSILNRYDDSVRLSGINTTPSISEERAKEVILADLISKNAEYTNGKVESIYLEIQAEQEILTYHAYVTCDNSLGFNYYVDAHSGEVVVANVIAPDYAYFPNGYTVRGNMWGLSTDIFYDTALKQYTFYSSKNQITSYDMNGADGHPIYKDKLPKLDGKDVNYDYIIACVPSSEYESGFDESSQLGFVNITGSSDVTAESFYAIYNFNKTLNTYKTINANIPSVDISVNLDWDNACALGSKSNAKIFKTVFGNSNGDEANPQKVYRIQELDTVGHEFTHYYQNCNVNSSKSMDFNISLGDYCGIDNSSNLKWVEAKAISEGTADIMGMLIEAINGECDFGSTTEHQKFWRFGENNNDNGVDHYKIIIENDRNKNSCHITVDEMNKYYTNQPHEARWHDFDRDGFRETRDYKDAMIYSTGPGHFDRYILVNAFMKMVSKISDISSSNRYLFKANNNDAKLWFELWGNAIKRLTPASTFADLRVALIDSAKRMGCSSEEIDAVRKGLDEVGITATHNADESALWYAPYVSYAIEEEIISEADSPNKSLTRIELLNMVIKYCEIDLTNVVVENIGAKNHPSAKAVQLGYNYGVLNSKWITNAFEENGIQYLENTIPRWEAANVLYGMLNISQSYHRKTGVWWNPLGDSGYAEFITRFEDRNNTLPSTDKEYLLSIINMNRGYTDDGVLMSNPEYTDYIAGMSFFAGQHLWGGAFEARETYELLYYYGMYELWKNGRFDGHSREGKIYLDINDRITLAEVCAILYQ